MGLLWPIAFAQPTGPYSQSWAPTGLSTVGGFDPNQSITLGVEAANEFGYSMPASANLSDEETPSVPSMPRQVGPTERLPAVERTQLVLAAVGSAGGGGIEGELPRTGMNLPLATVLALLLIAFGAGVCRATSQR